MITGNGFKFDKKKITLKELNTKTLTTCGQYILCDNENVQSK